MKSNPSLEYAGLCIGTAIEFAACAALIIFGHPTAGWWLLVLSMFCAAGVSARIEKEKKQ